MAKNSKKMRQGFVLFTITFLLTLVAVTYVIKNYSPNVDVEIGGENESQVAYDEEDGIEPKKAVDDRLKWIQLEDNMPGVSKRDGEEEIKYEETDTQKERTKEEKRSEQKEEMKEITLQTEEAPISENTDRVKTPIQAQNPSQPFKMAKIYVGSYSNIEQAIQAQNRLMETNLTVSPFVKEVNGMYVLQVGSYANINKAEALVRDINAAGFSATLVQE